VLRQYPVRLQSGTVYLDIVFETPRSRWNWTVRRGTVPGSSARDVRRDTELAALGWLVLRVTHRRLHAEPEVVRAEVLTAVRARRGQLLAS
jgi:hypothetical protein